MELYIFNRNLEFIGLLDAFTSLQWTRRYAKAGDFELHCALTRDALSLLTRENILWKKGDPEAGYIEYRNLDQDADGNETLVIKGKFLSAYLNRRIIWGQEVLQDTAENAMRTLVTKNAITPTDSSRIIPNLILGGVQGYPQAVNYQTSYSNLEDEIENLCSLSELGYRVRFDIANKKLVFNVYQGFDRSVNQSVNPRCIFAKEFENILKQSYTDSLNNYRNTVLVGGMGEDVNRKLVSIGTASDLDRFEMFDDAKDLTNVVNNVTLSDADYTNTLIDRGNSKLADTQEVQTFDSTINLDSNLTYKTDFDLGDIVTCVSKKWGITIDARITEVQEVYEEAGLSISVTFGNNVPTLLDKIKQKMR
ncbi:siphovirus ReqiPepy6 Gp37-like family protein [Desulfosporosinus sp. PR]|uniref:siphovirus ReqiPepy6 Gp37-like family protein n=1 Tax=Candidatus Desulfosporosinus nitrosoreducens TaxID=3401928 RepID=UPI0027F890F3|nr:siphovirus ReqiPepy6 Gp37-like family protein [Desulfosporosinus sp. PR]MDQ7095939.1 siphovirus ReqiPepy6 Gp37-like family protein [Desulfosporosinus sp. PR]